MKCDPIAAWTGAIWALSMIGAGLIARWQRRKTSFEDYTLASRGLSGWLVSFSLLGTWIGGGMMIALASKISTEGIVYLFMPVGVALSFLAFARLASAYRSRSKTPDEHRFIETDAPTSLVDRFAREYGEKTRRTMAFAVLAIMLAFMAVQLRSGALVMAHLLQMNAFSSTFLFTLVIAIYIWLGGARADAYTDFIQILIVLVAILGSLVSLGLDGQLMASMKDLRVASPSLFSLPANVGILIPGLLILPLLSMHTDSGLQQKLLMAKSDREASIASYVAAAVFLLFGLCLVAVSLLASKYAAGSSADDGVLIAFASNALHPGFTVLFYAAILSAVSSTLDSEALLVATIMVNDVLFRLPKLAVGVGSLSGDGENNKERTQDGLPRAAFSLSRMWAGICLFGGFVLTLVPVGLFDFLSVVWVSAVAAFSVPAIGLRWHWLKSGLRAGLVRAMILWSLGGVLLAALYYTNKNVGDMTAALVQIAFVFFFLNLLIGIVSAGFTTFGRRRIAAKDQL